jgi:hypothetical protein
MNRKDFVKNLLLVYGLMAVSPIPNLYLFRGKKPIRVDIEKLFESLDSRPVLSKHAAGIGTEYLNQNRYSLTKKELFKEFKSCGDTVLAISEWQLPSPGELQLQIRNDFENQKTVWLQGWGLSQTEAKLCALYTML